MPLSPTDNEKGGPWPRTGSVHQRAVLLTRQTSARAEGRSPPAGHVSASWRGRGVARPVLRGEQVSDQPLLVWIVDQPPPAGEPPTADAHPDIGCLHQVAHPIGPSTASREQVDRVASKNEPDLDGVGPAGPTPERGEVAVRLVREARRGTRGIALWRIGLAHGARSSTTSGPPSSLGSAVEQAKRAVQGRSPSRGRPPMSDALVGCT